MDNLELVRLQAKLTIELLQTDLEDGLITKSFFDSAYEYVLSGRDYTIGRLKSLELDEMDNGYRAITKYEGAVVEAGDQARSRLVDWHNLGVEEIGLSYIGYDFSGWDYRRPIVRYAVGKDSIYASDTKPVVDKA